MANTIGTGDKTDFDETRRLLYMATLVTRTKRYNLAGTLVNALVHHHAVDDVTADEAAGHVLNVVEGTDDGNSTSETWLRDQIGRITAELGD
jgi:hypothetical protein